MRSRPVTRRALLGLLASAAQLLAACAFGAAPTRPIAGAGTSAGPTPTAAPGPTTRPTTAPAGSPVPATIGAGTVSPAPKFTYTLACPNATGHATPHFASSNMVYYGDGTYTIWTLNRNDILILDQLLNYTVDGTFVPNLATSWTVSPDATRLHFALRKGVSWHDGKPFTAADVAFTIKAVTREETKSPLGKAFNLLNIKGGSAWADGSSDSLPGLNVVDDHTIEIELETPDATLLGHLSQLNIAPRHVFDGVAYKDLNANPHSTRQLIGTGPFKEVDYKQSQYITLQANESYHRGAPFIKTWTHTIYSDVHTAALAIERGDIALIANVQGETLDHLMTLPGAKLVGGPALGVNAIAFNVKAPKMSDKRVRQAFVHALDRRGLIAAFFSNRARIANSPIAADLWRNRKLDNLYPYDPAKAKALLREAGWDESYQINFITYYQDQASKDLIAALQQAWKAVGIGVKTTFMDTATFVKRYYRDFSYEAAYVGGAGSFDPDIVRSAFGSDMTYPKGINGTQYANPQLDGLLKKGLATPDPQQRKAIYDQVQEILADDCPWAVLWEPYRYAYTNQVICNLTFIQGFAYIQPEKWYVA